MISFKDVKERIKVKTDIHEHLKELYDFVVKLNSRIVVELGVRMGESTHALLAGVNKTRGILYSIDIDFCAFIRNKFRNEKRWKFIQGNDLEIVETWNKPIDLLFIDTEHTYDQCIRELNAWGKFVKNKGIITLHDTILAPGVLRAAKEYVKNNNYSFINREYCNGLGIIKVEK